MPALPNPRHEAFAQARAEGMDATAAFRAAGYEGIAPSCAMRLNAMRDIKARIAELNGVVVEEITYKKADAIRDLVTIIRACPADASADHPLCTRRMGLKGEYHRFPPKLKAMAQLIKMMGWDEVAKVDTSSGPGDKLWEWIYDIRRRNDLAAVKVKSKTAPPVSDADAKFDDKAPEDAAERADSSGDDGSEPFTANDEVEAVEMDASSCDGRSTCLTARQERFAQARFSGMNVMDAYHAAGYKGTKPDLGSLVNQHSAVKARLAELNQRAADTAGYTVNDAIKDLVGMIRARPSEAKEDHPLCEGRKSHWGSYLLFPSKLEAIVLLAKIMGWNSAEPDEFDPNARWESFMANVRARA